MNFKIDLLLMSQVSEDAKVYYRELTKSADQSDSSFVSYCYILATVDRLKHQEINVQIVETWKRKYSGSIDDTN